MIAVNYPPPAFQIKKENEQPYVFDTIRKTWLLLTEEEWVRQNFIQYLVAELNYPSSLIAIEKEIELNGMKKRFDVLVYNREHQPWMLIECKAPQIELHDFLSAYKATHKVGLRLPLLKTRESYATKSF